MTIIAWDGKTLAVDKQGTCNGIPETLKKYKELDTGEVLTWSGAQDQGLMLAKWYESGQKDKNWPEFQKLEEFTNLIVASKRGVLEYGQLPVPISFEDEFQAWGSGRKIALGAMAMGANAEEAVKITCQLDIYCGMGVDVFHFNEEEE